MARVSVIVPARNEKFVVPTVRDVLGQARGDVECIVVCDGYWPDPPLPDEPRLKILHRGDARGMRTAINDATQLATGDYVMKLDGHCKLEEGYDVVLASECADNWVVIPRRDRLDAERWEKAETGKPHIDYHYLGYPYAKPEDPNWHMHGNPWDARRVARAEILLDEEMSSQGSCWFMSRRHWDRVVGPLDVEHYGTFVNEFQEIGNKTWCSDGRVMVNKKTTYYHLRKGRQYGRGYSLGTADQMRGRDYTTWFWMRDEPFKTRVHSLQWLIERFWPVPTWPQDLDAAFADARRRLAA